VPPPPKGQHVSLKIAAGAAQGQGRKKHVCDSFSSSFSSRSTRSSLAGGRDGVRVASADLKAAGLLSPSRITRGFPLNARLMGGVAA